MNIAVCENSMVNASALVGFISKYCADTGIDCSVEIFDDSRIFLENYAKYPIVFLNASFGGEAGGLQIARVIGDSDNGRIIILTHNDAAYAFDGYRVNAAYYIVKPYTAAEVNKALERCHKIFAKERQYISILANREIVRIRIRDIIFAETLDKKVIIHTGEGDFSSYISMDSLEKHLRISHREFLRCHRSFIVNLNYVDSLKGNDFLMKNGKTVFIKKHARQAIIDKYKSWVYNALET